MTSSVTKLTEHTSIAMHCKAVPCTKQQFQDMWDTHPAEPWCIKMYGRSIPCPRFTALYGPDSRLKYSFSGNTMSANQSIPPLVQFCFDWAKDHYPLHTWNGALVNWYSDGSSYIGPHSDDVRDLEPGVPILGFSFGGERVFRLKKKLPSIKGVTKRDVTTLHGSVIAMCGACQQEYTHEVVKTKRQVSPRISVTVRSFKLLSETTESTQDRPSTPP
eukprot:m.32350 g.32350  ORF g.32350 m.32350 type:complete len:217 (-) comp9510_c0_seq1:121-771(-)